jgi:BNR repeat-containing family member
MLNKKISRVLASLTIAFAVFADMGASAAAADTVEAVLNIAPVFSANPVSYCLVGSGNYQFAAFYAPDHRMIVAARTLDSSRWDMVQLPERVGWDSHNYIAMGVDSNGCVHLSGNMHCVPLVYFRTRRPYDIHSFERIPYMVGNRESSCTYPKFMTGPGGELVFNYREGKSGAGDDIFDVYDANSRAWRRLLDQPLFSGEGRMNAYHYGPISGPDGWYHVCWVWRDTPDANTNHDVSYARSKDLVHWETSDGRALALPITIATGEIVDPVPSHQGLMNNMVLGFDIEHRPIVSYTKYDSAGNSQVYDTRLESGRWQIRQISNWDWRWNIGGKGSITIDIRFGAVRPGSGGHLVQSYTHAKYGSGSWVLDEMTLQPIEAPSPHLTSRPAGASDAALHQVESRFPGMHVRLAGETLFGKSPEPSVHYLLRWESLDANRDRPPAALPPPSMLQLYKLRS